MSHISYTKRFISKEYFESIIVQNKNSSSGTIGQLAFDKHLINKGWTANKGALRNAYYPFSKWWNEKTGEVLTFNFGLNGRFYIDDAQGVTFEVPATEDDFTEFEQGKLKPFQY